VALGDQRAEAESLKNGSYLARTGGDYQVALDLAEQGLPLHRAVGDPIEGLMTYGNTFAIMNDPVHASEAFEEADALQTEGRTAILIWLAAQQRDRAG